MRTLGHRIAQLGGLLMFAGGVVDMTIRDLLPHHSALLSTATGSVPDEVAGLVLALLRALGGALAAAGFAVLVLLWFSRRTQSRVGYTAAAVTAVLAEGPNTLGILSTGSPLFLAPFAFMVLVVTGCILCIDSIRKRRADNRAAGRAGEGPSPDTLRPDSPPPDRPPSDTPPGRARSQDDDRRGGGHRSTPPRH